MPTRFSLASIARLNRLGRWAGLTMAALLLSACAAHPPADHAAQEPSPATAPLENVTEASSNPFCHTPKKLSAAEQDRILQFASVVRNELEHTEGADVALIGRGGLDLERFDLQYSHGGVLLKSGTEVPWSVRQLYYDCLQGHPRLYDQGLAGYLLSSEAPDLAFVSVVLLPQHTAKALRTTALDTPLASHLLGDTYSANAYPFSTRYQNCNQWTAELVASALGDLKNTPDLRQDAQTWLAANGYDPKPVNVGSYLIKFIAGLTPLVFLDDHPPEVQDGLEFQLSLPEEIEDFVRVMEPEARRIEFCHDEEQIVIHHGWEKFGNSCLPHPGDMVIPLQQ